MPRERPVADNNPRLDHLIDLADDARDYPTDHDLDQVQDRYDDSIYDPPWLP